MTQIRNTNSIYKLSDNGLTQEKSLPNFFDSNDEIKPINGILFSLFAHIIFTCLMFVIVLIQGLVFPLLPKPELPNRDVEFRLVQNVSKPPINKNTKIRSDRDSQAGGKHDPTRAVSEPSPKASVASKKIVAQKSQPKPQPKSEIPRQIVKQQPKPQPVQPKPIVAQQPTRPAPVKAPSVVKPSVKPITKPASVAPVAPKIATAPKSPFQVAVPGTRGPVGTTYRPSASTSYGKSGSSASNSSAPAPKFSTATSSGGSTGSSGSKYATRGSSGGYGNGGNPSPGNPNGAPGIDAIRQPNWGPYMRDLEQRIKRNWSPPKGDSSKRVVITFTIGRDGRLLSHKVTKSSGVPLADRAAMSAIELTAPFRPLPPEFRGQSVPIEFTFDYNVLNSVLR